MVNKGMPRGTKQLVLKEKAQPARANPRRKATDNPKRAVATRGRKKMEEPAVHNTKRKRNAGGGFTKVKVLVSFVFDFHSCSCRPP